MNNIRTNKSNSTAKIAEKPFASIVARLNIIIDVNKIADDFRQQLQSDIAKVLEKYAVSDREAEKTKLKKKLN